DGLRPMLPESVPGLSDDLVETLALWQSVVLGPRAGQRSFGVEYSPQKVRWQEATLRADRLKFVRAAAHYADSALTLADTVFQSIHGWSSRSVCRSLSDAVASASACSC